MGSNLIEFSPGEVVRCTWGSLTQVLGCRRPNVLLHFGRSTLQTDPGGMRAVVRRTWWERL